MKLEGIYFPLCVTLVLLMIDLINSDLLRGVKEGKNGQYSAFCPICEADKTNGTRNLYFRYTDDKLLIGCKKGCTVDEICEALNIKKSDLFADSLSAKNGIKSREHIYGDESGNILGKKEIKTKSNGGKSCIWYRYIAGGYIKGLDGLKMPLYHLDKLINSASGTVYIVEGEKDVETMERLGFTATTPPNGAAQAKIPDGNIQYLSGKRVIIIHDNDKAGSEFADKIRKALLKHCDSVIVVDPLSIYPELHEKGDISDIVQAVGDDETVKRLKMAVENTPLLHLNTGKYTLNDKGVFLDELCIIPQPLLITKRFEDIETGLIKLEIAIHVKEGWKRIVTKRSNIADKNKIIALSDYGMLITSETAVKVVEYLRILEAANDIPTQRSISHMGHTGNEFVPYTNKIICTGDEYDDIYNAVHSEGNFETWLDMYKKRRDDNIAVRIAMGSSFASVLLYPLSKLPFFTHIWGNSGTGKTIILRLASSVWGYHNAYMRNMNSTKAGLERPAYFLQNLPLILDELQTAKRENISGIIYMLTEGHGKSRANLYGTEKLLRWNCAIITNGEEPLTSSNSGTGEFNRIIDIPVTGDIFNDPSHVYAVCDKNYGHAGQYFIEHLKEYNLHEILAKWESVLNQHNSDISSKHRMSLSVILTADELVNRMLFGMNDTAAHNDTMGMYEKLSTIMISTVESDLATRAYEYICSWISENSHRFKPDSNNEQWGQYSGGMTSVEISGRIFEKTLIDGGYNKSAVLKALSEKGFIKSSKNTKVFRMNGIPIRGVELIININNG